MATRTATVFFSVGFMMPPGWWKLWRHTFRLTPVLSVVLYTGTSPWSAAPRVIDLVTPGASGAGGGDTGVVSRTSPLFAGDRYLVLDTLRVGADDLRDDNAATVPRPVGDAAASAEDSRRSCLSRELRGSERLENRRWISAPVARIRGRYCAT